MAGILPVFELDVLHAIFGDQRAAHMPASWTVDLYVGDPINGGTVLAGDGGYAAQVKANTSANFPVDPDDPEALLLTLEWPASTAPWADEPTYLVLSDAGVPKVSLALSEPVVVAQAGVIARVEQPIFLADVVDLPEVG